MESKGGLFMLGGEHFMHKWKWSPSPRPFHKDHPEEEVRLLQEAAPESGLWHPRVCAPPAGIVQLSPPSRNRDNSRREKAPVSQRSPEAPSNAVGPCL